MEARKTSPATPETIQAIQTILKATREGGEPQKTLELVHLRVSQINGCSFCVDSGARSAKRTPRSYEAGGKLTDLHTGEAVRQATCRETNRMFPGRSLPPINPE